MAHIGALPTVHRHITGHSEDGKAILLKSTPTLVPFVALPNNTAAFGLPYTTSSLPADLSGDRDIDEYHAKLDTPPGLVINNGTVLRYVDMEPGHVSPMHRTVSLDYGIVIEGEVELILETLESGKGDTVKMKRGDVAVQRATMHAWRNLSDTEWARMLFVLQPCKGVDAKEELGTMVGVKSSS